MPLEQSGENTYKVFYLNELQLSNRKTAWVVSVIEFKKLLSNPEIWIFLKAFTIFN